MVGAGVSGLVSAFVLAEAGVEVVLYEKESYLGGHAKTVSFDGVDLDLGFMVFNRVSPFILSRSLSPSLSRIYCDGDAEGKCPQKLRLPSVELMASTSPASLLLLQNRISVFRTNSIIAFFGGNGQFRR